MKRIRTIALVSAGFIMGLLAPLMWGTFATQAQGNSGTCQTFAQTGHKVCGKFLTYWQQHGGLAQQGYPISEEFVETSDLNGKPYTVQYFERAVFELHPEYAGTPNEVLLSQLGTYLGRSNYPQGFSNVSGEQPFYEILDGSGIQALKSFYNAINRKEYERAYSYFRGAPDNVDPSLAKPYKQWVQGFFDTESVQLAVGAERDDPGAGNVYAPIPVVLTAKHTNGTTTTFYGCYTMHHTNPGIDPNPNAALWHINSAKIQAAPANMSVDAMLAAGCAGQ
jgi:hypothetical protein